MKNSCCKNNYKIVIAKILIVVSCFSNKVWTCQDSEYDSVTQGLMTWLNNSWIYLNMPDYVWICLKMQEYAGICVNMPKPTWIALILHILIFPFVLQSVFYFNRWLLIWTSTGDYKHSLKEQKTVFFKIQNLFFFHSSWKYLFVFYFRLDTFGGWGVNLDIPF